MKSQSITRKQTVIILSQIPILVIFAFHNLFVSPAQAGLLQQETTATATPSATFTAASTETSQNFSWLSIPPSAESLSSDRSLVLLAGEMIFHGLVDASTCPDNGLLKNGAASPCGENVARNAVILWQNQFDDTILEVSNQTGVPPFLLKNIIAQESQFWPTSIPTVYGYSEFGLGKVTEMGADTLLRWNPAYSRQVCKSVYSSDTCNKPYVFLPKDQQAALRGMVVQQIDSDCAGCLGGIDLQKARKSIRLIAEVLRGNYNHVAWMLEGATGRSVEGHIDSALLWRFTIASYNAGPGCITSAVYSAQRSHSTLSWKNVSLNLEKACQGAVGYVENVTNIYGADPQRLSAAFANTSMASNLVYVSMGIVTATPVPTLNPNTATPIPTNSQIPDISTAVTLTGQTPQATTPDTVSTATPTPEATFTPSPSSTFEPSITPTETLAPTTTPTSILAVETPAVNPPENELVVKFNAFIPSFISDIVINSAGGQIETQVDALGLTVISVPVPQKEQVLADLQNNILVEYVEPNYAVQALYSPNDPLFGSQTYYTEMQIPQSWDVTRGENVIVAVIDTGVAVSHPDLQANIWLNAGENGLDASDNDKRFNGIDDDNNGYVDDWQGWNFVAGNNDVTDNHGHGTHIAGIIAASMDNTEGMAGIAPSAQVMSLKALDDTGHGSYAQVAEAVTYAVDHGAKIINMGFGGVNNSEALQAATDYAYAHNVLIVAAAGNTGTNAIFYPAANPHVIGVSALDGNLGLAAYSSFGSTVDIAAPGTGIYSTLPGGTYNQMSGTSMSSAHVSGIAALLATQPQFNSPDAISAALFNTAMDLGDPGFDSAYGYGLVRAYDALSYTPNGLATPIVVSPTPTSTFIPVVSPTPAVAPTDTGVVVMADAANANINNYTRSCNVNAAHYPDAVLGGTAVTAIQENDAVSGAIPIGFDFWYMGTRYTQLYASSNGWLSFNPPTGNTCTTNSSCPTNDLDNSGNTNAVTRPFLAPLWDNLSGAAGNGSVASYTTTGIAPNRIFTFEWWNWQNTTPALSISMRVLLYENTGAIQFIYRQPTGSANPASASLGITGTANNSFLSANGTGCPPTWSTAAETANIQTRPATGTTYSFTPVVPTTPTGLNFTAITTTSMTLNWTDNSNNENGFVIYNSTDGTNFTYVAQTAANTATYNATGLTTGTTYHWRVYAVTEGTLSTALSGTQAAEAPPVVTVSSPVANGGSVSFVQGTSVTFTASAIDLKDGDVSANLQWTSSIDGLIGTGATFLKNNLSMGVHTITATVTDSAGLTASATITVTITDANGNTPPTVTITAPVNNSTFVQGAIITFTGSAVDTQDGTLTASLQWISNIDGAVGTGSTFTRNNLSIGTHTITARATDTGGLTGLTTVRITVTDIAGNVPPDVTILSPFGNATFAQGATVSFIGSAIIPTNGNISSLIQWTSNIDGALGTGASFGKINLSVGTHTITARATDSGGRIGSASVTITITTSNDPHGNFTSTTDKCAACHRAHTDQTGRLLNFNTSPLASNDFCMQCHSSGEKAVSTHSNIDLQNVTGKVEANFELLCIQCHNPHGSSNLYSIRSVDESGNPDLRVRMSPLVSTGPVVFTSLTGANSFDDGVSATANRLCVACHINPNNPGYAMVNHPGGANHGGGANYSGLDCTNCHPHSVDNSAATRDGFMTGCRACHSQTVTRTSSAGTRRQIVGAAAGDFTRVSHHVSGNDTVSDNDCQICHELSQHKQGRVRLYNVDNPATVYVLNYTFSSSTPSQADADSYENFCRSCHDSNGRSGDMTPFSDNQLTPSLSSQWTTARHNGTVSTFLGSCLDCHNSGHGSNKLKLLAPWNYTAATAPDALQQEEKFCYRCHDNAGPGRLVEDAFSLSPANTATSFFIHNVNVDRGLDHGKEVFGSSFANRHVECGDCHESHKDAYPNTAVAPAIKLPQQGATGIEPVYSGVGAPTTYRFLTQTTNEYQACFKCHSSYTTLPTYTPDGFGCATGCGTTGTRVITADGLRKLTRIANNQLQDTRDLAQAFNPANASFHPLMAAGTNTSMPASGFVTGWGINSRVYCTDCHTNAVPARGVGPHGSSLLHILTGSGVGSTNFSSVSQTARNNEPTVPNTEICFKCHDYATYVTGGASTGTRFRDGNQNLHTQHVSGGFTRTSCYTCHNTHGATQLHLINFDASVAVPQGGRTSEGAWVGGNPTATGTCYVACHGMTHGAGQSYTP